LSWVVFGSPRGDRAAVEGDVAMSSPPFPKNVLADPLEEAGEEAVSTLEALRRYLRLQGVPINTPFLSVLHFCFYGKPIDFRSIFCDLAYVPVGIPYLIGIEEKALPEAVIEDWVSFLQRIGGYLQVSVIVLPSVPSDLCQRVLAYQARADLRKALRGPMKESV